MHINSISLRNFRNYKKLDLNFNRKKNIFLGENAQGKTNLVEAIYLCAFSRSFRTNKAAEMVGFGSDMATVNVDAVSEDIEKKITIAIRKDGKKMIRKDGKVVKRTADLLNNIVVVVFSPDDLRIIKDSPERRRNFIDKEISQLKPSYYESLKNYKEALRQKNTLLKDNHGLKAMDLLSVYNEQLIKYGTEIIDARIGFIDMLADRSWEIQNHISNGKEKLEIKYRMSARPSELRQKIEESQEQDMIRGFSTVGPHRDDIEFFINGENSHKYASQGQQRTVALALKLAEIKITKEIMGENPVLILDDVLSELDLERQQYLLDAIEDVQMFITSTEVNEDVLSGIGDCSVFKVSAGDITEEEK